jgi:hypothetical protein
MDPVFDSNRRTGPLDGIARVNWISNQDWDPAQPLQGSHSQGLLVASSANEIYLLQMTRLRPDEVFLSVVQTYRDASAQALEVVRFKANNPVLIIAVNRDEVNPRGIILALIPPSYKNPGEPPEIAPLGQWPGITFLGPTKHTSDFHAFYPLATTGSRRTWYLAVALQRFQIGPNVQYATDSLIYKWAPGGSGDGCASPSWDCGELVVVHKLPTYGACDFESFIVGQETYVVLASATDTLNSNEPIRIYKVDNYTADVTSGTFLKLHQILETPEARSITPFYINDNVFLAVAQWRGSEALNDDGTKSPIYKWNITSQGGRGGFTLHQALPTAGARRWRHLSVQHASDGIEIEKVHYLAVANHFSNTLELDSVLYRFDSFQGTFEKFQTFETSGATDLAFLTLGA